MIPGDIRRYHQSSFPLLSTLVGTGQAGYTSDMSSFPRLHGNGGHGGTRLPKITNKVPLVALSQEDRNTNLHKTRNVAKYTTDTRRERAPDRNNTNRGKRSRGNVDSDLRHKAGPVGGQNSKPLSKQKNKRKPRHIADLSTVNTIDESERSSLEKLVDNSSKHLKQTRRHKSHVRESPLASPIDGKVEQRRRIKSCDRFVPMDANSLTKMKEELKRQNRESKVKDNAIPTNKSQRNTSTLSDENKEHSHDAPKPESKKRWKCIMIRHKKKDTPLWTGNVPADSWEEECKNANNLAREFNVNKTERRSETAKKTERVKNSEIEKKAEEGAIKSVRSKSVCSVDQRKVLSKEAKNGMDRNEEVRNIQIPVRCSDTTKGRQKENNKPTANKKLLNGGSGSIGKGEPEKSISDRKLKLSKARETANANKVNIQNKSNANAKTNLNIEKKACVKRINRAENSDTIERKEKYVNFSALKGTKTEKQNPDLKTRKIDKCNDQSLRQVISTASSQASGRSQSSKSKNQITKRTTSKKSSLDGNASPLTNFPFSDTLTSSPKSKSSASNYRMTVSDNLNKDPSNKLPNQNLKRSVSKKSSDLRNTRPRTSLTPEDLSKPGTPLTEKLKVKKPITPVPRSSTRSLPQKNERLASSTTNAPLLDRSASSKSSASLHKYRTSTNSYTSSRSSSSSVTSRPKYNNKGYTHVSHKQNASIPPSVVSGKSVSRIPILTQSVSTRSIKPLTCTPAAVKSRVASSTTSTINTPGKCSVTKSGSRIPVPSKCCTPESKRPVTIFPDSKGSKKLKSAIPVPTSPVSRTSRFSACSRRLTRASSRSSSASTVSTMSSLDRSAKSSASSIRTCISQASSRSTHSSVSSYKDDFEYESDVSYASPALSVYSLKINKI